MKVRFLDFIQQTTGRNRADARSPRVEHDASSVESSIGPWRKKATDVYSLFMAVTTLPAAIIVPRLKVLDRLQIIGAVFAWLLVMSAAILRRLPIQMRISMMVESVWLYAVSMLMRSGIFLNFRMPLIEMPMMVLILGGVRFGFIVGGIDILIMMAAVWGTQAGLFPQTPPLWNRTEAQVQYLMLITNSIPQLLLLAWFSHHLTTAIRRERRTAARLQEEAIGRKKLEGEVLQAGEKISRVIGSELHDGVCQDLTSLMLSSKRAQKVLESEHRPEAEVLGRIVRGLGDAIGEIHGLSKRLSPGALTGRDLAGAIEDLVQRFAEATDAVIAFRTEGEGPVLDSDATLHLYRIAQEAIANAVRHSGADHIDVLLEHNSTETLLRVDDNGHWLSADEKAKNGLGHETIRWRASIIGGTLAAGPMPGGGSRVECRVPSRTEAMELSDEL